MPLIHLTTHIHAPIERCFDLSRSIDLHKISTAKTRETAIAGTTHGLISEGESVTWLATHFGIRQRLTTTITAYDRPRHFRDEQTNGIFKILRHDHYFAPHGEGTLMQDDFLFESPFGVLGRLFNALLLTRYLKNFLLERNAVIKAFAESDRWKELLV